MKKAPSLNDLKTRKCSNEELQASLIQLIELHNKLEAIIYNMTLEGRILSKNETFSTKEYGL